MLAGLSVDTPIGFDQIAVFWIKLISIQSLVRSIQSQATFAWTARYHRTRLRYELRPTPTVSMIHSSQFIDLDSEFLDEVRTGLGALEKSLPCKYLYDQQGSSLFDQICELEEYYPTRTESQIMAEYCQAIAGQLDTDVMLVEYGSGSSTKTRLLLDSLDNAAAYVPVDISEQHLLQTAEKLRVDYPDLEVLPVVADFTQSFSLPESSRPPSHVALYFPGSTIGNFTPDAAGKILDSMSKKLGENGGLLIGIDLQKEVSIVEAAYNDTEGITAEFNLNLLTRINRELDADFDLAEFEHSAIYNDVDHRIEISIRSNKRQTVHVAGEAFEFESGEGILTEYSHKYTVDGFADFASNYGFSLHRHWTDKNEYFGVLHLVLD